MEPAHVQWGEGWYGWWQVQAHADASTAELRRALRDMTAVLKAREWAEHVSNDPDIAALETEITELVGRANSGLSADFKEALCRFERAAFRMGNLFERCQGKGWPDAESTEFIQLRDEHMPAIRAEIRAALGGSYSKVPFSDSNAMQKIAPEQETVAEWTGLEPATPGVTGRCAK